MPARGPAAWKVRAKIAPKQFPHCNGHAVQPDDWQQRLGAEWRRVEQASDAEQAALLARYHTEGRKHREIAAAIGKTHAFVIWQLRYHRFLVTTVTKAPDRIPERRFRAYWNQMADKAACRGRDGYAPDYEAKVFAAIREAIDAGRPPLKPAGKVKPATPAAIRAKQDVGEAVDAIRQEARRVYDRLRPTLKHLKSLVGCDRSTYAPDLLAGHAQVLDREIRQLFKLLADVDE